MCKIGRWEIWAEPQPQPVPLNEKPLHHCLRSLLAGCHLLSVAPTHPLSWALCSPRPPARLAWLTPADPSHLKCYLKSVSRSYTLTVLFYHALDPEYTSPLLALFKTALQSRSHYGALFADKETEAQRC